MTPAVIDLPFPPSLNRLWRTGRGRVYRSRVYRAWRAEADALGLTQKPFPRIRGAFNVVIVLSAERRGIDADNGAKAVLDILQAWEIIENDRWANEVTIRWGEAPAGCRVVLTPAAGQREAAAYVSKAFTC